jgi:hypothetical protein
MTRSRSQTGSWWTAAALSTGVLAGCSLAGWSSPEQCTSPGDCSAERVCERGTCVLRPDAGGGDGGADEHDAATGGACEVVPYPCDALVDCEARAAGAVACGECPAGFRGNGYDGCTPLLTDLTVSAGVLVPGFSPEVSEYTWITGMESVATSFTPSVSGGVTLRLDERAIQSGRATDSLALLPYEERVRELDLSARNELHRAVQLRTRRSWLWSDTLRASNRGESDMFGSAIAAAGSLLVVGAPFEASAEAAHPEVDDVPAAGAAYVFDLAGPIGEVAMLKEHFPRESYRFGSSVAATDDLIAVGAPGDSSNSRGLDGDWNDLSAGDSGAVWTFTKTATEWQVKSYVKSDNSDAYDGFGFALAMDEEWLIVGAPGEQSASSGDPADNSLEGAGAAYVFRRTGSSLAQVAYLKAGQPGLGAQFGYAVAVSQDYFAVGAPYESRAGRGVRDETGELTAPNSGAVYVFRHDGSQVVFDAYLKASNADDEDGFGWSVAFAESALLVGAPGESSASGSDETSNGAPSSGAAYVFTRAEGDWSQVAYLKSPRPREGDAFGRRLAACGERAVISAPYQASSASLLGELDDEVAPSSGALFVVVPDPWRTAATLKAPVTQEGSTLGSAVGCTAERVFGGARGDSGEGAGVSTLEAAGAVHIYR